MKEKVLQVYVFFILKAYVCLFVLCWYIVHGIHYRLHSLNSGIDSKFIVHICQWSKHHKHQMELQFLIP